MQYLDQQVTVMALVDGFRIVRIESLEHSVKAALKEDTKKKKK